MTSNHCVAGLLRHCWTGGRLLQVPLRANSRYHGQRSCTSIQEKHLIFHRIIFYFLIVMCHISSDIYCKNTSSGMSLFDNRPSSSYHWCLWTRLYIHPHSPPPPPLCLSKILVMEYIYDNDN